jgi:predicted transcriptional regulator
MNILEIYDAMMEEVQSVYRSRLQIQILLSLNEGNRTLSYLREVTGSTSQALIPKIRILESAGYVTMVNYDYCLTPVGRIVAARIRDYIVTVGIVRKHQAFFASHSLDGIPSPLLMEIGDLYDSEVISDTNAEIFNVFFNFVRMVNEGERIAILSPISSPAHTEAIAKRIGEGTPVEMVIDAVLARQLAKPGYIEKVAPVLETAKNLSVLVTNERIPVGLTVTVKCISLGLFREDGVTFDTTTDLFSRDPAAVLWGRRVFDYYKQDAVPLQQ